MRRLSPVILLLLGIVVGVFVGQSRQQETRVGADNTAAIRMVRSAAARSSGGAAVALPGSAERVQEISGVPDTAVVTAVVDGDTVEIAGKKRVRLIGIDAPEHNEPYFKEASAVLAAMVRGKTVRLEKDVSETDRYGRLLRYLYVGSVSVNIEMVRQGYARLATYPPDVRHVEEIRAAQEEARVNARGIWGSAPLTSVTAPRPLHATIPMSGINRDNAVFPACAATDCDCSDFVTHEDAQRFHDRVDPNDRHRLDRDHNGVVCEHLP